jgi:hypothetical protein
MVGERWWMSRGRNRRGRGRDGWKEECGSGGVGEECGLESCK